MASLALRAINAVRDGRVISGIKRRLIPGRRDYLRRCKGVIHVGANDGYEREEYAKRGLRVLWIEPIPAVFASLEINITEFDGQEAVQALITDRDGDERVLNLADVGGLCSSILTPGAITDILPDRFISKMNVTGVTLPTVMRDRDVSLYDALVIDTQGAELLVLRGAASMLRQFRYIECEAADFAFYEGYPSPDTIRAFLDGHGFRQVREDTFRKTEHGREFDMLFERNC